MLGTLNNFTNYQYNFYSETNLVDFCFNCLNHGVDWIYVSFYNLSFYNFKVFYFWYFDSILDESFDYFFFFFWFLSNNFSSYQLFFSQLLDLYQVSDLYKFPFFSEWYNFIFSSKEYSLFFIFHPEIIFFKFNILNSFFFYSGDFFFSLYNKVNGEVFFSPVLLFLQVIFSVFMLFIFISFYFSNYLSSYKEETTVDTDFLLANGFVEAEKELSAFDDILLVLVILIFIFGWYFYINFLTVFSFLPELILVFYFLPFLFFVIFGIPTFLIYDFGIFFLVYLRGVGDSSNIASELMFDYIAVVIFYTRILVQGIRLVLMLFTYLSMNDLVLLFSFNQNLFLGSEFFFDDLTNLSSTNSFSYFIFFTLSGKFIYWIYEILHTYFVVTVQFAAFFAIVFWLFLFFYTFFVIEKQENYFSEKRLVRKKFFSYLYNLK